MTDAPDDLLDAVQQLTRPDRRPYQQDILEAGDVIGKQRVTIELPPLLEQLDAAIQSSMGGASTKGASLAFEGSVLNAAALFEAVKISSQIRDWCRGLKVTPKKHSTADLDAWYAATLASPMSEEAVAWYTMTLRSWAGRIRGILTPPREREHPGEACPLCGATDWWSPVDGKRYLHPLITKYRPDDEDMLNKAKSLCRACGEVWNVRELAYALEHRSDQAG